MRRDRMIEQCPTPFPRQEHVRIAGLRHQLGIGRQPGVPHSRSELALTKAKQQTALQCKHLIVGHKTILRRQSHLPLCKLGMAADKTVGRKARAILRSQKCLDERIDVAGELYGRADFDDRVNNSAPGHGKSLPAGLCVLAVREDPGVDCEQVTAPPQRRAARQLHFAIFATARVGKATTVKLLRRGQPPLPQSSDGRFPRLALLWWFRNTGSPKQDSRLRPLRSR